LSTRRGTGYVYSSQHTSHEQAEQTFRDYIGPAAEGKSLRRIPMQVGYRQCSWKHNCVAIGLSNGFVEPLEATGLLVFDATARMLADQFPTTQAAMAGAAKRFNQKVLYSWDKVIDFIKLHYFLSKRDDSQFWLDNRDPAYTTDSLLEQLDFWQHQLPTHYDFPSRFEIFNLDNYQYVLYGMEFKTDISAQGYNFSDTNQANRYFQLVQQQQQQALQQLPSHRVLIEKIKKFGLQKV
jgi:tryptophan halogenase